MRTLWLFVAVATGSALVIGAASCGTPSTACTSKSCLGCCDASGVCQRGNASAACGVGGLTCATCSLSQTCSVDSVCVANTTCVPKTCADAKATCGVIVDGCGGQVTCGSCADGTSCGGGGTPNVCGSGTCTPKSCTEVGAECGMVSDGCSQVLNCGNACVAPKTCGGGGTANKCGGCQVTTSCAAQGKNCGTIADGCGGMLNCGACTVSGETCGGGGPNLCGKASCTPTTCTEKGFTCGPLSDNCGKTLDCGTCAAGTCGGGGVAGTCGSTCAQSCPTGYTCNASGACAGGSPTGLQLDVKTFAVSGVVTMNGAVPASTCTSADRATLVFEDAANGYAFDIAVPCNGATTPFTFGGFVYPGTYKVSVTGGSSALPKANFVVQPALTVKADVNGLAFDVKTFAVSGVVTQNGAVPTSACTSSDRATVVLDDAAQGYHFNIPVPCNGATSPFTFAGFVFPGTYRVSVIGGNSSLPKANDVVQEALVVNANVSGLAYDVKTFAVSGVVTMNGAVPTSGCSSSDRATVVFTEATQGAVFEVPVPCNGGNTPFTFSGFVFPGTYKVAVVGGTSSLPKTPFIVQPSLSVSANVSGLAYDVKTYAVSGVVTMNGAIPTSSCTSSDRATVTLTDAANGYTFAIPVPCNGATTPYTFSGFVYPGTYLATVTGGNSTLPKAPYVAQKSLVVAADVTNLAYDVKTFAVSGVVTMNGAIPTSACSSSDRATVTLADAANGYTFDIAVPCNGATTPFTFSGFVFAGTYKVSVTGATSSLPKVPFVVQPSLAVAADVGSLAYDVKTVLVSGTVTMNGALPTSACTSSDRATVVFADGARGYTFDIAVPCNGATTPFTFGGYVYPGTYRVSVVGGNSALPKANYVVFSALQVP